MAIRGRGGKFGEPRLPTRPEVDLYSEAPAQLPEIVIAPPKGLSVKQIPVGGVVKTPIKQPPMPMPPVKPPRAEPVKVPVKQPPVPVPQPGPVPTPMPPIYQSPPIIPNPGTPPIPVPPPVPEPVPVPQPMPIPQPAPVPTPLPTPVPPPVKPMPGESGPIIPNPGTPPIPVPPVVTPPVLPPAPPVNELPPPIQVPPPNVPVPEDILSRGTVGPVAPPPPPVEVAPPPPPVAPPPPPVAPPPPPVEPPPFDPAMDYDIGPPPAPPRPVAPPPVQVPPPIMQPAPEPVAPAPEPVAPPIPLAPSQPGVPTPMAPGSFQGVLPAPTPEAAPEMPAIDPEVLAQIERELSGPGGPAGMGGFTPPAEIVQQFEEPLNMDGATGGRGGISGIETMAPAVGFGDYLGSEVNEAGLPALSETAPAGDIPMPDGSSFDLSSLNLSDTDMSELANFNIGDINLGQIGTGVDSSLYSDPALGGGPPPMEVGTLGGPVYDADGNLIGNLGTAGPRFDEVGGMPPRGGEFDPGVALPVDDSLRTTPNTGTPTFGPQGDVVATDYFHYHELIDSGLSPDQIDTSNLHGFGQTRGDTGSVPGSAVGDGGGSTANLYPDIPSNVDTTGMTPEQLQGLNDWYASGGPANINIGGIPGFGGIGPINIGGTTGTTGGSYTVTPVAPVGDLDGGDGSTDGQVGTAPPPGPVNVRSASTFGLTGVQPTMPVGGNPFQRPESQQGIGSLAGGG